MATKTQYTASTSFAPIGNYNPKYVKEIFLAYQIGLSMEEIAIYIGASVAEVNHILDGYLPIVEAMGAISYDDKLKDQGCVQI